MDMQMETGSIAMCYLQSVMRRVHRCNINVKWKIKTVCNPVCMETSVMIPMMKHAGAWTRKSAGSLPTMNAAFLMIMGMIAGVTAIAFAAAATRDKPFLQN